MPALNHIDNSLVGYVPGQPGFLDLVTQELGNVGDPSDGFDAELAVLLAGVPSFELGLAAADAAFTDMSDAADILEAVDPSGIVIDFGEAVPVIDQFVASVNLKTLAQLQLPPLPAPPAGGPPLQPPVICNPAPQPPVVCTPPPPLPPAPPCPPGESFMGIPPVCTPTIPPCPPGETFSPTTNQCEPPPCPPGTSFVSTTGACEPPPPPPPPPPPTGPPPVTGGCPPGSSFISTTGECQPGPCPPGFIDVTGLGDCFPGPPAPQPPPPSLPPCPPGQAFVSGECQPTPVTPTPQPPQQPCPPGSSFIQGNCVPNAPGEPCPPGYILYTDYTKTPPVSVCTPGSGPGLPSGGVPGPIIGPCPVGTIDTGAGCQTCEDPYQFVLDPNFSPSNPCVAQSPDPGNCVLFVGDQCLSSIP